MPPDKTGVNANDWVPNWLGADNVLSSVMEGETRMPCVFQVIHITLPLSFRKCYDLMRTSTTWADFKYTSNLKYASDVTIP